MDIKCIFIVVFALAVINQQEVDTRLGRYATCLYETFDDINNIELYEFVMRNPQVVNKWLDSISFLIEADEKQGIGKVYEVFIGKYSAYFNITELQRGELVAMETDSLFLFASSLVITFHETSCESSSAMQIQHHFKIDSILFQNSIGIVLRKFFEQRLQRALGNLKIMLCELRAERFLLY